MKRQVIRFAVGSPTGLRASVWRCFTHGKHSDIYLAPSSIADSYKVSLHEPGTPGAEWRLAFTKQFREQMEEADLWEPGEGRLIAAWPKSVEIARNVLLAFRVLVPASAVTIPTDLQKVNPEVVWIPPSPRGRATEVSFIPTPSG
jgi:hypothetical protein